MADLKTFPDFSNHWHYLKPGALFLRGIAALAVAFLAIFAPGAFLLASSIGLGLYFLVDGISAIAAATQRGQGSRRGRGWYIAIGALGIVAGLLTIINPAVGVFTLSFLIGVWAVVGGALAVQGSLELRRTHLVRPFTRHLMGVLGVASVVMGGIILWQPAIGMITFLTLVSFQALLVGISAIALGFEMRRHGRPSNAERPSISRAA